MLGFGSCSGTTEQACRGEIRRVAAPALRAPHPAFLGDTIVSTAGTWRSCDTPSAFWQEWRQNGAVIAPPTRVEGDPSSATFRYVLSGRGLIGTAVTSAVRPCNGHGCSPSWSESGNSVVPAPERGAVLPPRPFRALFVTPQPLRHAWSTLRGTGHDLGTSRLELEQAIRRTVRDARGMGFTALLLSSYNYEAAIPSASYLRYISLFAREARAERMKIVPSLPWRPGGRSSECERTPTTAAFVKAAQGLGDRNVIPGLNCPFESWASSTLNDADPASLYALRTLVEGDGRFLMNVPAARSRPPQYVDASGAHDTFTLYAPQVSPWDPRVNRRTAQQELDATACANGGTFRGVVANLWHEHLHDSYLDVDAYDPGNRYMALVQWAGMQRLALRRCRPLNLVVWDYRQLLVRAYYDTRSPPLDPRCRCNLARSEGFGRPRLWIVPLLRYLGG